MNENKQLLDDFIEWAKNCGEDVFYIFENTEEAIERFFDENKE